MLSKENRCVYTITLFNYNLFSGSCCNKSKQTQGRMAPTLDHIELRKNLYYVLV